MTTSSSQPARRAVVTGAASGIGAALAGHLARSGLSVIGLDKDPCTAGGVQGIQCDLSDLAATDRLISDLETERPVDVLVSCAGIFQEQYAADLTLADYHRTLNVNLHAPVLLMSRCAAQMAARGWGRIVAITSIHARFSEPGALAYDVAKGGLEAATRTLAIEHAADGVLVNAVAPGYVDTAMSVIDGHNELDSQPFQEQYLHTGRLPARRAAQPDELAAAVAHLVSDANTYQTGSTVTIDGGLCARF